MSKTTEILNLLDEMRQDDRLDYSDYSLLWDMVAELEPERDERFPEGYAEVEYSDFDNAEAIEGAKFDDMNFLRYFER